MNKKTPYLIAKYASIVYAVLFFPIFIVIAMTEDSLIFDLLLNQYGILIGLGILFGFLQFSREKKSITFTKFVYLFIFITFIVSIYSFWIDFQGIDFQNSVFKFIVIMESLLTIILFCFLMKFSKQNKVIRMLVIIGILSAISSIINTMGYIINPEFPAIIRAMVSLFLLILLFAELILEITQYVLQFRFFSQLLKK